jgi:two-component system LytT family sensor kinase
MQHPLIKNKINLYSYFMVWISVCGIHTFTFSHFFNIPIGISITDASITTATFAVLGLLSWYTVRFISIDRKQITLVVFNHLVAALLFIYMWYLISDLLLRNMIHDKDYLFFLYAATPFRIVGVSFLYCILALSFYLYKFYDSYKARIEKDAAWKTLAKESELTLLKSQLQPHFIFNSLNSIHALMEIDTERAKQMLTDLSSYLRLSIEKNEKELIPLSEELENSELYYSIEKIRFGNRLLIETNIKEETLPLLVPNMILQPLLENAIKHGIFESTEVITIQIDSWLTEKFLHISIKNNHDPEVKKKPGYGLGIKHVQNRFALLYGRKNLVRILDEKGIFQIELTIPQY